MYGLPNVPTELGGAYFANGHYQCKCRDIGKVIRTRMNPSSAFSATYIESSIVAPGTEEYIVIVGTVFTNLANVVCASQIAVLPSWITSQDELNLLSVWTNNQPVVTDLQWVSGQLQWVERETPFDASGPPEPVVPCVAGMAMPMCAAINYNNLAYGQVIAPNVCLTDGVFASCTAPSGGITISLLPQWTQVAYQVLVWAVGVSDFSVVGCSANGEYPTTINCLGNVSSVAISWSSTPTIEEIQVYVDGARV